MAARLRFLVPAVLAAAAFSVPAANAGLIGDLLGGSLLSGNCASGGTQVFAPWQDFANYYLAPNGSFEIGTTGWSLSGGAACRLRQRAVLPDRDALAGAPERQLGAQPDGLPRAEAALRPHVRERTQGGTDSGLRVRVVWYGLLNKVLGIPTSRSSLPAAGWSPTAEAQLERRSRRFRSRSRLLGSRRLTPTRPRAAQWQIDDLYIDPCVVRIG